MREILVVQTGQCGNQIGAEFWRTIVREHREGTRRGAERSGDSASQAQGTYTDSMSTFLLNTDSAGRPTPLFSPVERLKARAVLVDMEEGVLNSVLASDVGKLFDSTLLLSGASGAGSGNNFGEGYRSHGDVYASRVTELLRGSLEKCDSAQGFLFLNSIGGGTGSGLGARVIETVREQFPGLTIISAPVVPSKTADDVITSPYNSVLSMASIFESADVVFPFDNEQIMASVSSSKDGVDAGAGGGDGGAAESALDRRGKQRKPFREVNSAITAALSNITSSMRFGGEMNVDLNELAVNLVPFRSLNLVCTSLSGGGPAGSSGHSGSRARETGGPPQRRSVPASSGSGLERTPLYAQRSFRGAIKALFSPANQLVLAGEEAPAGPLPEGWAPSSARISLASAVLARGASVNSGALSGALDAVLKARLVEHPSWGNVGFKVGICEAPPAYGEYECVCLRNSPQITRSIGHCKESFDKLFQKKMFLHHYTRFLEMDEIRRRRTVVDDLIAEYAELERTRGSRHVLDVLLEPLLL